MSARTAAKVNSAQPDVTIVISFRERWRFTARTVASIVEHTTGNYALWLLDPGLPEAVRAAVMPHIEAGRLTLVPVARDQPPNQARGEIAARLQSRLAVFIDNDVMVTAGWLEALIACADETGAGIVCPLYLWGQNEHSELIHMAGGDLELVPGEDGARMTESHRHVMRKIADVPDDLQRRPCGFGEYHCVMMRREIYSAEGMFEPGIATVHEHIHASMLAREMGFETWFEPASRINYLAFAPWRVGELDALRTRWDYAAAEDSLSHFAQRWNIVDDGDFRAPVHRFLTIHASNTDVLDPRPGLGAARDRVTARTDLEHSFAGLQRLAIERGYDVKDVITLRQAYRLAMGVTAGQYRPCGRPFINHLAGTASVLLFYGCAMPQVVAALLHAAHTHGPKKPTRHALEVFKDFNPQARAATRIVALYADRLPRIDQIDRDALDQLPVEIASLCLLDAANEVDMRLSLEVAVSGRTDILAGERMANIRMVMEQIGLRGLAATLDSLGEGETTMVPFEKSLKMSFRVKQTGSGEPERDRSSSPLGPAPKVERVQTH
ncbi:MAG: glycosyltransferase [Sphingomicrobium sp.]